MSPDQIFLLDVSLPSQMFIATVLFPTCDQEIASSVPVRDHLLSLLYLLISQLNLEIGTLEREREGQST